ncbi:MAG: glucuronyl hydrolase, partial [Bacteroidales bacterium]|nr:glucuronyl hydrolase [Bacteroidales bacterium]
YLQQAVNVGDMILQNLPEDGVTYWDFNDPAIPDTYRDASAAAVMASAYLELGRYVGKKQKREY